MSGGEPAPRRVIVNVIGVGAWGPNLVRAFVSGLGSRVGRICDRDPARRETLGRHFPYIECTADPGEAIEDEAADAVVIATPPATHHELARRALLADKDVLVEKPLTADLAQGEELVELAAARGRILMVGHVFRYNASIRAVKQLLEANELGRIISIHATRTNLGPIRSDVNALWDLGAHDLSIFRYWLGDDPVSVSASGICELSGGVEDTVIASYAYPGGVLGTIHASWLHPRKVREITVVGESKMLVWSDIDLVEPVRIYDKGVCRDDGGDERYGDSFGSFRMSLREGNVVSPPVRGSEPLAAECAHFTECVLSRKAPLSDGAEGLAVLRALAGADASLRAESRRTPIG